MLKTRRDIERFVVDPRSHQSEALRMGGFRRRVIFRRLGDDR